MKSDRRGYVLRFLFQSMRAWIEMKSQSNFDLFFKLIRTSFVTNPNDSSFKFCPSGYDQRLFRFSLLIYSFHL